ncbi:MAG: calcium/proton exchanger [Chthoniobacterales bacterium]|nr:calcium/proton exchanger [Chthoniobacterales bacterium]
MASDRHSSWSFTLLDLLLVAVPAAIALRYVPAWQSGPTLFVVAAIAIVPLAGWMGRATEQLASRTSSGVGGFLNATFGNAAELIIALVALSKGLTGVVKASITGSIIGNLLLVLGASILVGGIRYRKQTFNQTAARISATSLGLGAIALMIPTVFHRAAMARPGAWTVEAEQRLSLAIVCVLFLTYFFSLFFHLVTHRDLFSGPAQEKGEKAEPHWPLWQSITALSLATALIAWISEFLVGSIESARHTFGLTETFVGVVVVALVGNAAEHSTAVWTAWKNKMDLSLTIATGSSLQMALFVTPVLVFCSYWFGDPMTLEFSLPEIASIVLSIWIVGQISGDGESNWLEGVQLLSVYIIIGILFYYLPALPHH